MTKSQELKSLLKAEYPNVKFSVRQTRNNGWIGQLIEVGYRGEADGIHSFIRVFESQNFGYTVEAIDLDKIDDIKRQVAETGIYKTTFYVTL